MDASAVTANAPQIDVNGCTRISLTGVVCAIAIVTLGLGLQISHGFLNSRALLAVTASIAFCVAALVVPRATLLIPFYTPASLRRSFFLFLVAYFVAGIVFLRIHHRPIDVLIIENDSANTFLHGVDPYGRNVTHQDVYAPEQRMYGPGIEANGRVRVGFQYPPLTIFWILPGYLLGDVRYSFLAAVVLTGLMIFYCEPNLNGLISAILLLLLPNTLFVLSYGWTEPLILMTLAATVLVAKRAPGWVPVALGLFFASKQYSVLAAPLAVLLMPKFSLRAYCLLLSKAGAIAAIVTLPFLAWDPRGFWWSLVRFHSLAPLRKDALSWSAALVTHGLPPIPQWCVALVIIVVTGLVLWKVPPAISTFPIAVAMVFLFFFVLNKQAFLNYYFFCFGALCLGVASDACGTGCDFILVRYMHDEHVRSPK
jgi:hypothetical protein